jgi:hypothetical protein
MATGQVAQVNTTLDFWIRLPGPRRSWLGRTPSCAPQCVEQHDVEGAGWVTTHWASLPKVASPVAGFFRPEPSRFEQDRRPGLYRLCRPYAAPNGIGIRTKNPYFSRSNHCGFGVIPSIPANFMAGELLPYRGYSRSRSAASRAPYLTCVEFRRLRTASAGNQASRGSPEACGCVWPRRLTSASRLPASRQYSYGRVIRFGPASSTMTSRSRARDVGDPSAPGSLRLLPLRCLSPRD